MFELKIEKCNDCPALELIKVFTKHYTAYCRSDKNDLDNGISMILQEEVKTKKDKIDIPEDCYWKKKFGKGR